MLKKLMITTALSGLTIGAALAQGSSPPASSPPASSPPAATQMQPARPDAAAPAKPSASTATPSPQASAQFVNSQKSDQWLASKFKGTDVLGSDDKKIGDVTDILFDRNGKVEAYIVSVGGFLGMGAKDVALAPSAFQVVPGDKSKNEADKLKITMTKDQLKQAANFERYNPPRSTTGMATPSSRPAPMAPPASSK